jgi:hypothetical protein
MRLRTFSRVRLEGADFTRPKPLLLLCYLALEGSQDRRFLAELFWPDARDRMRSLAVALARLRRGAPGAVEADDKRAWTSLQTDAGRFLTLLEKRDLEKALECCQGPFLEGFYLREWGEELEEWVHHTREYLASRARKALLELAERAAARARFDEASKHAEDAYRLRGAPALESEELTRLHTLLCAGESPLATEVAKEAAALIGLIEDHSALTHALKERVRRLATALRTALSPDALERGKTLTLAEVVAEVLRGAEARS